MKASNLALKFLLELAALAALTVGGAHAGPVALRVVLAVAAPLAMILVWARWCAPRAAHRLPVRRRIPLELAVFAVAVVALALAGHLALALVLAALVVLNAALLTTWHQWEA